MYLEWLSLTCFRNYKYQHINFEETLNIIYGDNAQGKTNLLEAIHLLITLQPFRSIQHKEFIFWNEPQSIIEGSFVHGEMAKKYTLFLDHHKKKPHINDNPIGKAADYLGGAHTISFLPQDLGLLQGAPRQRRRYFDKVIYGFYPHYADLLSRYYKALVQRNAAFHMEREDLVELWGEQLCEQGGKVHLNRLQFIQKLNTLTSCLYRKISGSEENMFLKYESEIYSKKNNEENIGWKESDIASLLRKKQIEREADERRLRRSLVGPHSDDISFLVGNHHRDLKLFGSQGEQRTAVLAIKLAELTIFDAEMNRRPIFLLDDITSELDHHRMQHLFSVLREKERQIFVTTTNPSLFLNPAEKPVLYHVTKGNILYERTPKQ